LAFIQLFPGFGEAGHDLQVRAAIGEAIEDVGGDSGPLNEEGVDRIPAARILRAGNGHLAGGKSRCGGQGRGGHGKRDERCRHPLLDYCHLPVPLQMVVVLVVIQALIAMKWPGLISSWARMAGSSPTRRTGLGISPSIMAMRRSMVGS